MVAVRARLDGDEEAIRMGEGRERTIASSSSALCLTGLDTKDLPTDGECDFESFLAVGDVELFGYEELTRSSDASLRIIERL